MTAIPYRKVLPRRFRRLRVLIAGCGDVGLRVLGGYAHRARFMATARRSEQVEKIRQAGGVPLRVDLDDPGRRNLGVIASRIVWLVPPDAGSPSDRRLARTLADIAGTHWPRATRLIYCGTTGVWGNAQGRLLDETAPISPQSERAQRRADAERRVRQAVRAAPRRFMASLLRVPGIYAADRLPVQRLQAGLPTLSTEHDAWSNHIHADDLATILWQTLWHGGNARLYIASDGQQLRMGDYFDQVADRLGLNRPPRGDPQTVRSAVSPAMWSFMRESRRLSNQRMLRELRVRLRYPDVASTLADIQPAVSTAVALPTEPG